MTYKSVKHISSNELGEEEVVLEYERTFLQWIFRKPNTIKTFVGHNTVWHDKNSGKRQSPHTESHIIDVIKFIQYHH